MSLLPTLLRTSLALLGAATFSVAGSFPDELKVGGFVVGCQAWTFNKSTVFETIEKTASTGAKVIEFFPGQKLSPEEPTTQFGHAPAIGEDRKKPTAKLDAAATKAVWDKVKAKLKEQGITPVAYGVVQISTNPDEARAVFEFAKYFGIRVINTESVDAIDTFEPLVKEYDIKVGFHDHPKRPDNPNYRMWDPNYILEVVKDRDPRIGSCADIGHWVTSGLNALDCLKLLKGRIVSSHLKDRNAPLPSGKDVVWGTGVNDVSALLDEFRAQGFEGPISAELENILSNDLEAAKACIAYIRAYGAKK
jgi:sugar phosphate isomerase/epimerase